MLPIIFVRSEVPYRSAELWVMTKNGRKIYRRIVERGIQAQGVFSERGRQTTVKTRIIAHHPHYQQLVRVDRETTDRPKASTFRSISSFLTETLEEVDGIVISDYGKGLLTRRLIQPLSRKRRVEEVHHG